MKKLSLLMLTVLAGVSAFAQGTVNFQNGTVTTAYFTNTLSTGGARGKVATTAGTMFYGLFYSDATLGGTSNNLTFATAVANSTSSAGVIQGTAVMALPGTNPGDQIWLMTLAWSGSLGANGYTHYLGNYGSGTAGAMNGQWDGSGTFFAQSPTILVTGGPSAGPGTVMYQTPTDSSHIGTAIGGGTDIYLVPEPSTFALAGLGAAAMLIFRRRK